MGPPGITAIVERLRAEHGATPPPAVTDPFEMILYENVAYLVDDAHRDRAFENLRSTIGTTPADILSASPGEMRGVAALAGGNKHGQIEKLVRSAQIASGLTADLTRVVHGPPAKARSVLKTFPGIGDPGADKILLFNRVRNVLALESNGLRVLTRIGFADEQPSYAATYRAVQKALEPALPDDTDFLIDAHQLLRRHGKEVCRRTAPQCERCAVRSMCRFGLGVATA